MVGQLRELPGEYDLSSAPRHGRQIRHSPVRLGHHRLHRADPHLRLPHNVEPDAGHAEDPGPQPGGAGDQEALRQEPADPDPPDGAAVPGGQGQPPGFHPAGLRADSHFPGPLSQPVQSRQGRPAQRELPLDPQPRGPHIRCRPRTGTQLAHHWLGRLQSSARMGGNAALPDRPRHLCHLAVHLAGHPDATGRGRAVETCAGAAQVPSLPHRLLRPVGTECPGHLLDCQQRLGHGHQLVPQAVLQEQPHRV
mmetsp:Transcript_36257/g.90526  ORF Transcript_36257/g.90526 Transcript_36257/m.90526 type:complete len:251 (+) Transcript_36257:388-1140(+)